ncbi:MAG: ABC transporter ATP-binding protein [Herpetosiphon sp.]
MTVSMRAYREMLVRYLGPQRWSTGILTGLLLGTISLELLNPQVLRNAIDAMARGDSRSVLLHFALLFIGIAVLNQLVAVFSVLTSERVAWWATNRLRGDLLLHCLRLPMSFHVSHTPGEMIERIDGDVGAMAQFFGRFVFDLLGSALLLVGILVVLWWQDWRIGLALTLFAALTSSVLVGIRNINLPYESAARAAGAQLWGFLEERLAALEELRANGAGSATMLTFGRLQRDYARQERLAFTRGPRVYIVGNILFTAGYLLALGMGIVFYRQGTMTLGTVFLLYQYTELLRRPLERLSHEIRSLQEAGGGLIRVLSLFGETGGVHAGSSPLPVGPLDICFGRVSFEYRPGTTVVNELNVEIPAGTVVGLVGRTGSGKTTLARLVLRLYKPLTGRIALGGVDLEQVCEEDIRGRIGVVSQDVHLFQATLRDNLSFWDSEISDSRLTGVLDELGLLPWLQSLPAGLDTEIDGTRLSAGEAQLLGMARVFLQDPSVVILDEASSRLDPLTERLLQAAVQRLVAGRTAIIIAHRLSTIRRADRILILDRGGCVEYGARIALEQDPASLFSHLLRVGIEEVLQ